MCELCEMLWARRFYNRRHYCWAEKLCETLWARRFYNRRHYCWAEKLYVHRNCASQKKPAIRTQIRSSQIKPAIRYFVEFITFNHHIPNLIKNYCRITQNFSSHFQNSCLCGMPCTNSLPIMLALCSMLLPSYYAGIIGSE